MTKGGDARKIGAGIESTARGVRRAPSPKQLKRDLAGLAIKHFSSNVDRAYAYIRSEYPGVKKVGGDFIDSVTEGAKQAAYNIGQAESERRLAEYRSGTQRTTEETPAPQRQDQPRQSYRSRTIEEQVHDAASVQRAKDAAVLRAAENAAAQAGRRRRAIVTPLAVLALAHGADVPVQEIRAPAPPTAATAAMPTERPPQAVQHDATPVVLPFGITIQLQ